MGQTSIMRSIVCAAEEVCSVPNTRCPVSAAIICKGDGFVVAHLADEDNVGVIAQGDAKYVAAQRIFPLEAPPIIRVTSKTLV